MNESEVRAEYIGPTLNAAEWGGIAVSKTPRKDPIASGRSPKRTRRFAAARGFDDARPIAENHSIMRTTLDLPEELLRRLQRRAEHDGRTPEQIAADLLEAGLEHPQRFIAMI